MSSRKANRYVFSLSERTETVIHTHPATMLTEVLPLPDYSTVF